MDSLQSVQKLQKLSPCLYPPSFDYIRTQVCRTWTDFKDQAETSASLTFFLLLVCVFHLAPISCSSLMLLLEFPPQTLQLWGWNTLINNTVVGAEHFSSLRLLLGTIKCLNICWLFLTMSSIILNMAECILHGGLNAFNQETLVGYVDTVICCQYS